MAYVTARKDGRFEIRESRATPRGPRSRTLASFRVLDDDVLRRARERATGDFDEERIRSRARALGAVIPERSAVDETARELIAFLREGRRPAPVLEAVLRVLLEPAPTEVPDELSDVIQWIGATPTARGRAVRDLLRLVDRLPRPRVEPPLAFPPIRTAS